MGHLEISDGCALILVRLMMMTSIVQDIRLCVRAVKAAKGEAISWYQALLSVVPGRIGGRLRAELLRPLLDACGKGVIIKKGVLIWEPRKVSLGNDTSIGAYCQLNGAGSVKIGSNVMIGPFVMVTSVNHGYQDTDRPMNRQPLTYDSVTICNDVWVGGQVSILPGVMIGEGSIVAAGAVVNRSVHPYSIVGGVPARLIRRRTQPKTDNP